MPSISNEDMVRTLCITVKSKSETVFFTICKDGGLRFSKKRVSIIETETHYKVEDHRADMSA